MQTLTEFRKAIEDNNTLELNSPELKIAYFQYAIKCVRAELCSEALSNIFDPARADATMDDWNEDRYFPIFQAYQDLGLHPGKQTMTLDGGKLLARPVDKAALIGAAADIERDGYIYQQGTVEHANYYPELDFTIVFNGQHHAAAATMSVPVHLRVQSFPLEPIFHYLSVEGNDWVYGATTEPVLDPRFAIMYDMARRIWEIKQEMETRAREKAKRPLSTDPRVCRLTGIRPETPFRVRINDTESTRVHFDAQGILRTEDSAQHIDATEILCWALNHPDHIIRID